MARKRKFFFKKKKDSNTNRNGRISEAASSEDKDGLPPAKPNTDNKPPGPVKRKRKREEQAPLLPTRTSSRVPKRIRRDISPPNSPCPPKKPAREHHPKTSTSTPEAKKAKQPPPRQRRAWEQWSCADKSLFFEGLLEFGKDFDPLTNYVAVRQKKRLGLPPTMIKNKEQIRHFYYRTWHKISKWIEVLPDIKKQTQELYGLINYNEMRKHLGSRIDDKIGAQLNELVHRGSTQIKVRGKLHRLKTPMCRALKRLNGIEDPKDDGATKLPQKIALELRPRTNSAWAYVQSLSQNPRVRMTVRLDRRLSNVIDFLEKKWTPHRLKIREILKLPCESDKYIKVLPPSDCTVVQASLKIKPPPKKIDIALNCHVQNLIARGCDPAATITTKKMPRGKNSGSVKNPSVINMINAIPAVKDIQENAVFPPASSLGAKNLAPSTSTDNDKESTSGRLDFSNTVTFSGGVMEFTLDGVNSVDKMMTEERVDVDKICPITSDVTIKECAKSSLPSVGAKKDTKTSPVEKRAEKTAVTSAEKPGNSSGAEQLNIGGLVEYVADKVDVVTFEQKFRAGWVLEEAKCVTLAEIYLALGSPETVVLEYEFHNIVPPKKAIPPEVFGPSSSSAQGCDISTQRDIDNLAGLMRKLVQLATTEFVDLSKSKQSVSASPPSRCTCGATLKNSPGKSSSRSPGNQSPAVSGRGKSPATPKGQGRRGSRSKKDKESLPKEQLPPKPPKPSKPSKPSAALGSAPDRPTDPDSSKLHDSVFRVPLSIPAKAASYNSQQMYNSQHTYNGQHTYNSQQAMINQNNKAVLVNAAEETRARQFIQQLDSLSKRNGESIMMKRCRMRMKTVRKPMLVQRAILPKAQMPGRHGLVPLLPQGQTMDGSTGQFVPIMTNDPITGQTIGMMPSNTIVAQPLVSHPQMISGPHTIRRRPVLRKIAPCQTVTTASPSFNTVTYSMPNNSQYAVARTLSSTTLNPLPQTTLSSTTLNPLPQTTFSSTTVNSLPQTSVMSPLSVEVPKVSDHLTPVTSALPTTTSNSPSLILSAAMSSSLDISTPSVSSLLDIAIPGPEAGESQDVSVMPDSTDKLIDLALGNSTSFSDFLNNTDKISPPGLSSPPRTEGNNEMSISIVGQSPFKVDMANWLQGESSCDVSLSGFLDSPVKRADPTSVSSQSAPFFCENSRDSITSKFDSFQVDSMLQCMMNESSVDYGSKFADLAAQFAAVPDNQYDTKK